jgi:hypothetical protein
MNSFDMLFGATVGRVNIGVEKRAIRPPSEMKWRRPSSEELSEW